MNTVNDRNQDSKNPSPQGNACCSGSQCGCNSPAAAVPATSVEADQLRQQVRAGYSKSLRSVRGLRRKWRRRNRRHRLPRVAAAALLRNPPHPQPPVAAAARPPSPPCPQAADVAGRQPLRRNNLPQRSATPRASSQARLPNQTWDSPAATPPRSHHSALVRWCWILAQAAGSTALSLAQRSALLAK